MKIREANGLPFVSVNIVYKSKTLELHNVLLDTGSASSIFNADTVRDIGIVPEGSDVVDMIRGVGGVEYVYTKILNEIRLDNVAITNFQVEIGSMDYGMEIDGIIGFDFMKIAGFVIDMNTMTVASKSEYQ